jgi:hypothetical protein
MELTKELFIQLTGEDPSQYKGVKRIWQHPNFTDREYPVQHTAESLVRRVVVDDPNLFTDGILETKRGHANYTFAIIGNLMTCTLTFTGSQTSITYYFEKDEQVLDVKPMFILEEVEPEVFRIVSASTVNGTPVEDFADVSEVYRLGGGIVFDKVLNAPVLTHDAAVRANETFTSNWSKAADNYLPFAGDFAITCEVKVDDGNLRYFYTTLKFEGGKLVEAPTPSHHKHGQRLFVRPSDWK